jgi:pimeloyl-ACP methyl ester carboxylesterase
MRLSKSSGCVSADDLYSLSHNPNTLSISIRCLSHSNLDQLPGAATRQTMPSSTTSSPAPHDETSCGECQKHFGCLSTAEACTKCEKLLCSTCAARYPLIPVPEAGGGNANNDKDKDDGPIKATDVRPYCKGCFQETSVLDFARSYDVIEPTGATTTTTTTTTFLMVHGGGGSRAMFRPHAEILSGMTGGPGGGTKYRSVLLDLPGHGTMADTPLTLDGCVDAVLSVIRAEGLDPARTVYVGGSLGAYLGFYILDRLRADHKISVAGAVLMDCGQNVGPGCSLKASVGLWFLKAMGRNLSNRALMKAMVGVMAKSQAQWRLVESTFGAGMFFDSAAD